MSILNNSLLLGADAGAAGYQISRSLRFNSADSAYLSRTPASAGNRKTWTWAGWVKRGSLSGTQWLFECSTSATYYTIFALNSDAVYFYDQSNGAVTSTALYRDPGAWMHLVLAVDTTQATASNRVKMYVNGAQITALSGTAYPTQNADTGVNSATLHSIGARFDGSYSLGFNGYLADIHFIDGQALTPSSFVETNATTGQWVPKAYTGSYGTNGFRLDFSDNSAATATTLGKDRAGSNNWTPNNLSVTAGVGNDSLVDTPTSYGTDTGAGGEVRGNYCTWNPLIGSSQFANSSAKSCTFSNGNLDILADGSGLFCSCVSTLSLSSGKWYAELEVTAFAGSTSCGFGFINSSQIRSITGGTSLGAALDGYLRAGVAVYNGAATTTGLPAIQLGDVITLALDITAGEAWFGRNGSWDTGDPALGIAPTISFTPNGSYLVGAGVFTSSSASFNAGQRPFSYTAPSSFKALCDTNLPAPVVAKPSSAFDCVTYTGTGATLTPTSSLGFSPDLVWIKSRSAATDHTIYDAVRGTQARLESNNTDPEVTSDGGLTAFNSNGFTLGTLAQVNTNAATYVAWCWDEAVADGFDIVTYTGNGANRTIAHSLGVAPSFMIVKQRTAASATNWAVWHSSLANTEYLLLNSTAAKATGATYWNSTSPTSTNFSLGTAADVNTNNGTYVAYLWSSVVGYSAMSSFLGNADADGPFQWCGFRPKLIIAKVAGATGGRWAIFDSARIGYNGGNNSLTAEDSAAENNYFLATDIDILSNGFKIRHAARLNASGEQVIWAAWAESPFQYARAR